MLAKLISNKERDNNQFGCKVSQDMVITQEETRQKADRPQTALPNGRKKDQKIPFLEAIYQTDKVVVVKE